MKAVFAETFRIPSHEQAGNRALFSFRNRAASRDDIYV